MRAIAKLLNPRNPSPQSGELLLTGWGRTAPSRATVVRPASIDQIATTINQPGPRGLIARGLGRSYGDPAQNAGGTVIDMTGLYGVKSVNLDTATVTVDAGISLHRMMQLLVPLGLFVPVTPGTRYVTVGGAIACDIHGKNHHVDGAFSNHVLGFSLLLPSGQVIEVDRTSAPVLFDATRGGMGLTGIILTATIQMIPITTSTVLVDTERLPHVDALMARMEEDDDRYRYSVAWVDTLARGNALGRGVLYRGNHLAAENAVVNHVNRRLDGPVPSRLSIPDLIPAGLVGRTTAKAFNEVWYRKHPRLERQRPQDLSAFFHQLDMVENANRVYGSLGFVQHQCVLPDGKEAALLQILEILSERQVPTYLVVLKRMGAGIGLLSFPVQGWTLAIDVPAGWQGLTGLLDQLDRIVVAASGRVYFAKDARMDPDLVTEMYPEINRWRDIVNRYDPDHRMVSDLSRRLRLRGN